MVQRTARLASRAVRSILLYGIGTFARRPRITTGSLELGVGGEVPEIPDGARTTDGEFYVLQDLGRQALGAEGQ